MNMADSIDENILVAHPELQARVDRVPGAKELSKIQQEMIAENLHFAETHVRDDAVPLVSVAAFSHEDPVLLGGILEAHPELKAEVKRQERFKHYDMLQEEMIAEEIYQSDLGGRLPLPPLPPRQLKKRVLPKHTGPKTEIESAAPTHAIGKGAGTIEAIVSFLKSEIRLAASKVQAFFPFYAAPAGILTAHLELMADVKMAEGSKHFDKILEELIAEDLTKNRLASKRVNDAR